MKYLSNKDELETVKRLDDALYMLEQMESVTLERYSRELLTHMRIGNDLGLWKSHEYIHDLKD